MECRCPVHGMDMSQIDGWYYPEDGRDYTIVGCSRGDCGITARFYTDRELELEPDWMHLLQNDTN